MRKNIFVIGLDPYNLRKLEGIRHAERYNFHSLLEYEEVVKPLDYPYESMLKKAEEPLRQFSGSIDAIISYWDFPGDTMVPILCEKFGLPSPSLEDILKCGHKYWARLEQQKIIPEHIPRFCAVDPFADDPLAQIDLPFPSGSSRSSPSALTLAFISTANTPFIGTCRPFATIFRASATPSTWPSSTPSCRRRWKALVATTASQRRLSAAAGKTARRVSFTTARSMSTASPIR